MNYIPKKAQRQIEAMKNAATPGTNFFGEPARIQLQRTRLSIYNDPTSVLKKFDVYLDGVKQDRCTVADSELGYINRFKVSIQHGEIETINGEVQIVPKGCKPV